MNQAQRAAILIGLLIALSGVAIGTVFRASDGPNDCGTVMSRKDYTEQRLDAERLANSTLSGFPEKGEALLIQLVNIESVCHRKLDDRRTLAVAVFGGGLLVAVVGGIGMASKQTKERI